MEYYFDDPADDSDSAEIPKMGYAREFHGEIERTDGSTAPTHYVIGVGHLPIRSDQYPAGFLGTDQEPPVLISGPESCAPEREANRKGKGL